MDLNRVISILETIKVDKYGQFEPLHTWYNGIDLDYELAINTAIIELEKIKTKEV